MSVQAKDAHKRMQEAGEKSVHQHNHSNVTISGRGEKNDEMEEGKGQAGYWVIEKSK